jgi:hypothetical protein
MKLSSQRSALGHVVFNTKCSSDDTSYIIILIHGTCHGRGLRKTQKSQWINQRNQFAKYLKRKYLNPYCWLARCEPLVVAELEMIGQYHLRSDKCGFLVYFPK